MKECKFCEHTMKVQNFNKHMEVCSIKNTFGIPKSQILKMIEQSDIINEEQVGAKYKDEISTLKSQNGMNEMMLEKTFKFIKDISDQSVALTTEKEGIKSHDPIERINLMFISDETRKTYISEWSLYQAYCNKENLNPFITDSANSYIENSKATLSTIIKKKGNIQSILSHILNTRINLRKIRRKPTFKPKYALSAKEVEDYLSEQKQVDYEDYLLQKLLIEYGCRINTAGAIKVSHLEFLRSDDTILLPDTKTGERMETITEELRLLLTDHVNSKSLTADDYLFTVGGSQKERLRVHKLGLRINKRIRRSKVLKKSKNYKYTSHMFRKTKAFNIFQNAVNAAKNEARNAIGQKKNSTAIEPYINM